MAERYLQLSAVRLTGLLLLLLSGACSTLPPPTPGVPPAVPGDETPRAPQRPVTAALLEQSRAQRLSGELALASSTLDRAIRIDPRDPVLWLELARVRYVEGNWAQAEQLARKARALAAEDSLTGRAALRLQADALERQGRAPEAERLRRDL